MLTGISAFLTLSLTINMEGQKKRRVLNPTEETELVFCFGLGQSIPDIHRINLKLPEIMPWDDKR